ncbi:MAG: cysteine desulfurase NifS [Thermodesulfobacteriota bacterium]
MRVVYMDNNATTKVDPRVVEEMLPFFTSNYGNPSSMHLLGGVAQKAVKRAREQVAELLNAHPEEIVFTSCGTESDNAAIRGILEARPDKRHVVTTRVEHPAVWNQIPYLRQKGYRVTEIRVDREGRLDLDQLRGALTDDTALVSVMFANNETGVVFPVAEIGELVKARGIPFHTDAVQAVGKLPVDLSRLPVDLLSMSGHKIHAPKGIGVLYIRRGTRIAPFMIGGHQEKGRRGGTENVPYIVGLGKAAELSRQELAEEMPRLQALRDRLEQGILERIPNVLVNGSGTQRLPNTLSCCFEYVEGESLLLMLSDLGICASSGSACTSGSLEPSHVLRAMGVPYTAAHGSIRFSLSRFNTQEEVDYVMEQLPPMVERLRAISPFWRRAVG